MRGNFSFHWSLQILPLIFILAIFFRGQYEYEYDMPAHKEHFEIYTLYFRINIMKLLYFFAVLSLAAAADAKRERKGSEFIFVEIK